MTISCSSYESVVSTVSIPPASSVKRPRHGQGIRIIKPSGEVVLGIVLSQIEHAAEEEGKSQANLETEILLI